jgi:phosphoribosylformylglycinamidine synthase I
LARIAVIKFPGTNCDEDVVKAFRELELNVEAEVIWYKDFRVASWDAVIVPGGFSYGDWLRAGAIAARNRVMEEIREGVSRGLPVLGICNGFQILVEAELLPGALLPNESGRFTCRWISIYVERSRGPWLSLILNESRLDMPVAHAEGRYYVDEITYHEISSNRPLLRYKRGCNPNGSAYDIAGVGSEDGSVLGLMPHPERALKILTPRGFNPGGEAILRSIALSLRRGW